MENFQQVDLTNYATKLELTNAQTTLQNNINTNTNNINSLNTKDSQNVKLTTNQTINGTKTFSNQIIANGGLTTNTNGIIKSNSLELGYGYTFAYMTSDDDRAKSLKLSGKSGRGKLDLDMGGNAKITNLPNPTNTQDAATKDYVDNNNALYKLV